MKILNLSSKAWLLLLLFSFANSASGAQATDADAAVESTTAEDGQRAAKESGRNDRKTDDRKPDAERQQADKVNGSRKSGRQRPDSPVEDLSKEAQRAAIAFATEHHPALASLVKKLRSRDSDAYGKAVRELHGDSIRLKRLADRQPKRFETEIALWKLDSEIRLQLARWAVSGNEGERFEKNVRRLLTKRHELRRKRLKSEHERLVARMQQVREQLEMKTEAQQALIEQELNRLSKRLRSPAGSQMGRKKLTKDNSKTDEADSKAQANSRPEGSKADQRPSAPSKKQKKSKDQASD